MILVSLIALLPKWDYTTTFCTNNKNESTKPQCSFAESWGPNTAGFYLHCIRREVDAAVKLLGNRSYRENEVWIEGQGIPRTGRTGSSPSQ